jgi:predicted MFS family arabinose efflux permease
VTMALASTGTAFTGAAGLLVGIAQSGCTYAVIYGVIGRNVSADRRTWAMGVAAAAGSFGQFLMVPVESALISEFGWQNALYILGAMVLVIVPLAFGLREPNRASAGGLGTQSIGAAVREAFAYPSFRLLMAGYFVCGFQVVFIGVHMPSYLRDRGLDPQVATMSLALIGLFNVIGTYAAGEIGQRWPKRYLLSAIYLLRSLAIVVFLLLPLTPMSVYVFSAVIGLLWLSTVPPTNAVVAQIFGVQYLSMLGGFVFLSHQLGSFMGVWLGGKLFDASGSYDVVWWIAVALGIFAGMINLPLRETPIVRAAAAAA